MKSLIKLVILSFCLTSASHLQAQIVEDIRLKSPIGNSLVTAEVSGVLNTTCLEVRSVTFDFDESNMIRPTLNFYLDLANEDLDACANATIPYRRDVFVGSLDHGEYVLNVFDDRELLISKTVFVPDDVHNPRIDIDLNVPFDALTEKRHAGVNELGKNG